MNMQIDNMNVNALDAIIKDVDLLRVGGDLLHIACAHGKAELVKHLVSRGAMITQVPDAVEGDKNYRKTPHVITAALSGDKDTFEAVINAGGNPTQKGFIGFSRKKKNLVKTNVIGAAAWANNKKLLEFLLTKLTKSAINIEAAEE